MPIVKVPEADVSVALSRLKFLSSSDIANIEEALKKLGPSGELHLIIENGNLLYVRMLQREIVRLAPRT